MKKVKVFILTGTGILSFLMLSSYIAGKEENIKHYEATWASLEQKEIPVWLEDAKFGIYAHWGIYSIGIGPAWTEKHLYNPDYQNGALLKRFEQLVGGSLKDGEGYKDLVPFFKAEKYDPAAWADLVKKSGAKFAGFSISHHDGFGLWDSDVYPWNAGKMGPKRDLYGDFVRELRKRNIKIYATSHMYRTFNWMIPPEKYIEQAKREHWDVVDPRYKDYYPNSLNGGTEDEFYKLWNLKIREVIDKYHPDLFWFDGGKFMEKNNCLATFAYYFNQAEQRGQEVYIANKYAFGRKFNFPDNFGIYNFENGRDRPVNVDRFWMDDINITGKGWGYGGYDGARPSKEIIKHLIDNVSRGGGLIVSLAPRLNGTIPEAQQNTLLETGKWLQTNGEAIFGTRKWFFPSDDSPEETSEKYIHRYRKDNPNTRWDYDQMPEGSVRYTQKVDTVYILTLGIPAGKQVVAKRFSTRYNLFIGKINNVTLLGAEDKINWKRTEEGLVIDLPEKLPNDKALAFKITLQK